jgi:uncharacterized damage-inducible protein DinB
VKVPQEMRLIVESFARNGRVNRSVLATLTMSDLTHDDGAGGWNVGKHLADIVDFRHGWLTRVSPQHAERVPIAVDIDSPTWLNVASIEDMQAAFDAGDAAMLEAILYAVNEGRSFEKFYVSHPAHLMQHCIVTTRTTAARSWHYCAVPAGPPT